MYKALRDKELKVLAVVDNDSQKWGKQLAELKVISPKELAEMKLDDILVIIVSYREKEIQEQLREMGIEATKSYEEFLLIPRYETFLKYQENPELYKDYLENICRPKFHKMTLWDYKQSDRTYESTVVCCMPQKVGNCTIFDGVRRHCPTNVLYANAWHTGMHVNEFLSEMNTFKKKIITAVREPISQNLSMMFQILDDILWDQPAFWEEEYDEILKKIYHVDAGIDKEESTYSKCVKDNQTALAIQKFFDVVFEEKLGIPIYDYPFDKKAGYSIIKVEDVEIFVYQLEKLDLVYKELLRFIGIPEDTPMQKINLGTGKNYDKIYQKVKETITFSQEYFDWSLNTRYIQHFYSDEDIEKFKQKWSAHVRTST